MALLVGRICPNSRPATPLVTFCFVVCFGFKPPQSTTNQELGADAGLHGKINPYVGKNIIHSVEQQKILRVMDLMGARMILSA